MIEMEGNFVQMHQIFESGGKPPRFRFTRVCVCLCVCAEREPRGSAFVFLPQTLSRLYRQLCRRRASPSTRPSLSSLARCVLCPNMFGLEEWLVSSTILFTKCAALKLEHPGCILLPASACLMVNHHPKLWGGADGRRTLLQRRALSPCSSFSQ